MLLPRGPCLGLGQHLLKTQKNPQIFCWVWRYTDESAPRDTRRVIQRHIWRVSTRHPTGQRTPRLAGRHEVSDGSWRVMFPTGHPHCFWRVAHTPDGSPASFPTGQLLAPDGSPSPLWRVISHLVVLCAAASKATLESLSPHKAGLCGTRTSVQQEDVGFLVIVFFFFVIKRSHLL